MSRLRGSSSSSNSAHVDSTRRRGLQDLFSLSPIGVSSVGSGSSSFPSIGAPPLNIAGFGTAPPPINFSGIGAAPGTKTFGNNLGIVVPPLPATTNTFGSISPAATFGSVGPSAPVTFIGGGAASVPSQDVLNNLYYGTPLPGPSPAAAAAIAAAGNGASTPVQIDRPRVVYTGPSMSSGTAQGSSGVIGTPDTSTETVTEDATGEVEVVGNVPGGN